MQVCVPKTFKAFWHKIIVDALHRTSRWHLTSCPGKFTENYLKDRAYGNPFLDCDQVRF